MQPFQSDPSSHTTRVSAVCVYNYLAAHDLFYTTDPKQPFFGAQPTVLPFYICCDISFQKYNFKISLNLK